MPPVVPKPISAERLQRLVDSNIQLLPITELPGSFVFEREGFVAIVERRGDHIGAIGTAGMLTSAGVAMLMMRAGRQVFVTKGYEQEATAQQIADLRQFQTDLEKALS